MQTAIFLPPLPRMSGGMAVLLQVGEHLARLGHPVCFVPREPMNPPPLLSPCVPCIPWEELRLTTDHIWLVPEGWAHALAPGLAAGARCVVYVQNWAYVLGSLPAGTRWDQLPVRFLAVSDPVRWFLHKYTGQDALLLRPGIDTVRFHPPARRTLDGPVRIAWMPRKNKALARQIKECLEARLPRLFPEISLEWEEIHGRTPDDVASLLRTAHIFLATGFPEGCPLPPLEAMASDCLVTGFSGLGGWDYMRQALPDLSCTLRPWWPLREVAWGGNGIFTADADIPGAALAVETACLLLRQGGPLLEELRHNVAVTAAAYSLDAQQRAVAHIWNALIA